jgi:hypothetical protein
VDRIGLNGGVTNRFEVVKPSDNLFEDISNYYFLAISCELPALPHSELSLLLRGSQRLFKDISLGTVLEVETGFEFLVKSCQGFIP